MRAVSVLPDVLRAARRPPPAPRTRIHYEIGTLLRGFVLVALAGVLLVYLFVLWPWMLHWGATPDERTTALPGDELVADATDQSTRAVLVRAPADEVWRWLVQIGQDRGGFYSYDWLENLVGADIHNADRVHPEWQTMRAGDVVRAIPPGWLGGVLDEHPGWRVAAVGPGRWFVLEGWGVFLVKPVDEATSRLVVRTRFRDETWWGPVVTRMAFGPVHFVMERRMLLGIKERAEAAPGTFGAPRPWQSVASIGFTLATMATAYLLWRRRHAWRWLAAPMLLAVAVLLGTGDAVAAAAGFVTLGLVLLGVPILSRDWPLILPVPAAVLLVLLLARDAYVALGVAFVVVALLAAGTAILRPGRAGHRAAAAVGPQVP